MATIALSRDAAKQNYATLPMLAEALGYAAKGWLVIPLNTPTSNFAPVGALRAVVLGSIRVHATD